MLTIATQVPAERQHYEALTW